MKAFVVAAVLATLFAAPAMAQNTSTSLAQSGAVINQSSESVQQAPGVGGVGLVASGGTCLGSTGGGISGPGFGLSFGSTQVDPDCTRRQYAALLAQLGHPQAAVYVTCNNTEVRNALAAAGVACPATAPAAHGARTVTRNGITAHVVNVAGQAVPSVPLRQAPRFFGVSEVMTVRR